MTKARAHSEARTHALGIFSKLPPLGNTGGKKNKFLSNIESRESMKFLKSAFNYLVNDSFVTFVIGFVLGMVYISHGFITALNHLESLVCK